jgi:biotin carboxyl carrier protein
MKLKAELAGTEHALELQRYGARVVAAVDSRRYELLVREIEPGVYLLQLGERVYECHVRTVDSVRGVREVSVRRQEFQVTLIDPKRLSHTQAAGVLATGREAIIAPMPGRVVRLLVEAGSRVEAGVGVIIVEAMKMQNEMKSPKAGVVVSMNMEEGATVNAGDVLAVIE